jgi:hypothetical protein
MSRVIAMLVTGAVLASCSAMETAGRTVSDVLIGGPIRSSPGDDAYRKKIEAEAEAARKQHSNNAPSQIPSPDCPQGACPQR